jgi:hypothetical protein
MRASVQASLAEEIRGIVQDDVRDKTGELATATDTARQRLIDVGKQALDTAGDLGTLIPVVHELNKALNPDYDYDGSGGISPEAEQRINDAINNAQTRLELINAMGGSSSLDRGSGGSGDSHKEGFENELKELKWQHDMKLISEEEYLNRLRELNDRYFKDSAKYLDEWRKTELEIINSLHRIQEQNITAQISLAESSEDFDRQIELYRQLQENIQSLANEYRQRGFRETDNEILELQDKWQGYYKNIQDIIANKYGSQRTQLEFQLSIAEENLDFGAQINLYRQFQKILYDEANEYRRLGLQREDAKIQELQRKHRAYSAQIVKTHDEQFKKEREAFDRHLSKLDFTISITSETNHAEHERLINEKIENRLENSRLLVRQMTELLLVTD